mmetsp:Transcript_43283/g.77715  ORF Transcript_43283/g.77715 Transcript_43283/m.77715 type:complete len:253 (-) Transcript_43283:1609-2367(-)
MVDVEALNHHLQGHCSDIWREVEQTSAAGSNPLPDVLGVGERGGQRNDADGLLHLHGDVAHAADHCLQRGANVTVQEMQLVHDEEANLLHTLARLPTAAHEVPLIWRCDDDVGLLQNLHIAGGLTNKLGNFEAQYFSEFVRPLVESLLGRRSMWRNIDAALDGIRIIRKHSQDSELTAYNLPACRGCADEAVVVGGVEGAERLRLDRVEHFKPLRRVQLLCPRIPERRQGQWLQVEKLCVWWVLLRKDQVPK